jgi:ABC-type sugar transport system ATPase subunit
VGWRTSRALLFDERLSALDMETHAVLLGLLRTVQRQTGVTILHVTHNPMEARTLGSQTMRVEGGAIRALD